MTKSSLKINKYNPKILANKLIKIKKSQDINYNQLIKVINIKNSKNIKIDLLNIKNIPKYLDYEEFISIICRDFLQFFPTSTWKKHINKLNNFDLTYPLFWACEHASFNSVRTLLSNGVSYKPNTENRILSPISIIIKMINVNKKENILISFKNFCGLELSEDEKKIEKELNNYKKIFMMLLNKFPNIVNNINEYGDIFLISTLNIFCFDLSKEILLRYKYINDNSINIIKYNFEKIFRSYLILYKNMQSDTDNKVIFSEFIRYKMLFMFYLILELFDKKNLSRIKIDRLKQIIDQKFGSLSNYDSIFHTLIEDFFDSSLEFEICKIFSTFERIFELNFDKKPPFYYRYMDKFNFLEKGFIDCLDSFN